ncbi:Glucans biosynthesis protein C [Mycolicibacterium flavescens]|uniref:acyltransferase family protein n=1 Tax=Mycobacterium neumannii TaxID=2048551 RepID=UPI000B945C6C|nr:acyltransferase family protein [Mycobacterium neumannii]VEG38846.1 Glucans biosynthesis protein C [Mycolicibacterium flavescens]
MQPATERLHSLDAVRAFALLAGVAFHATAPWIEDGWAVAFEPPSATAAAIWYFLHMFRMPVFFLIAGYFGRLAAERRGTKGFTKDRAKRIALPLVVGIPLIPPLTLVGFALGSLASGMSVAELTAFARAVTGQAPSATYGPPVLQILGHLWFLYYLLLFYVAALILRRVCALDRGGEVLRGIDRILGFFMRTGLVVVAFALLVATWYSFVWTEWPEWTGRPAPVSVVPFAPALLGYGFFFVVGWLLHRQNDLLIQQRTRWVQYLLAGAALAVLSYLIAGPTPKWSHYLHGWELYLYAVAYLTASWCLSFALIGLALRFLSNASPVRRYVADSSYWLYLMHLAPIALFVALMRPLAWHWSVKYSITIAATVTVLLLSYQAFVRYTFIGATLNGRRHQRTV